MADISQVNLPNDNNNPYDIADTTARSGLTDKMDKVNPVGSGSFSLNRKADTTIGTNSFASGNYNTASGSNSFAEGYNTTASGNSSHAEGASTTATGYASHTEGEGTATIGESSHAEGYATSANGQSSHAEGYYTITNGQYSHAEGYRSTASGAQSHAEGYQTTASSNNCHTEGFSTTASGASSHAEGYNTTASGEASHAEGQGTAARGYASHTDGTGTIANHAFQHVFGEYNVLDDSTAAATARGNYVEIVGNGTSGSSRSNARTLDWSGNEVLSGTIEATGFGTTLDKEVDRGGVQLTQAQYDALVNAGTVDANTTYFITDANNTTASYAAGVTYDNTSSGVTATNVQGAIDEVVDDVDKLHMRTGRFNSANPLVLPIPSSAYGVYIIFGFFQGIGAVLLDVRIVNRAISKIYNLRENTEFSSSNYSFTYSSTTGLTITSTIESQSYYTALYS